MRKIVHILLFAQISMILNGQIIADHTVVDRFDDIPQQYIDEVKKMLLIVAGESHTNGYFEGLLALKKRYPELKAEWTSAGAPHRYTDKYLRIGRNTWGDYDNETGWINWYGEEDWFTNPTALSRTKAGIKYSYDNGLTISAMGFGWCSDQISGPSTIGIDPVFRVHWAGRSKNGPEGNKAWGIDEEDYTVTRNSICMDTYIIATQEYIDYCAKNSIPTTIFFTTGPVDSYSLEDHYQGFLKHEHLRAYVRADPSRILFDYADILCFDDDGSATSNSWNRHLYPAITPTNLTPMAPGHISKAGSIRLAKAMWWMLARIAGWDGN